MHNVGICTCANDQMLPFLRIWFAAARLYAPGIPIGIIPFDDRSHAVEAFAREHGVEFLGGQAASWRSIGSRIYGAKKYRRDTPSASYFSKLAAFNAPFKTFMFLDVNAIFCAPISDIFPRFMRSDLDIIFRFRASEGRNYATLQECRRLNKLNPGIQNGFNANFFVSRHGTVMLEDAEGINDAGGTFGKAPEQSFLTRIIAEKGLAVDTVHRIMRYPIGASCHNVFVVQGETVVLPSRAPVMFIKWNGPRISPTMANFSILEHLANSLGVPLDIV